MLGSLAPCTLIHVAKEFSIKTFHIQNIFSFDKMKRTSKESDLRKENKRGHRVHLRELNLCLNLCLSLSSNISSSAYALDL